jgi:hypothetical protein
VSKKQFQHQPGAPATGRSCPSLALRAGVVLCLLLALAAPARATTYGDIEVILLSEPKDKSWHGYFEYVFLVTNHSKEQAHTVTLSMPDQKGYTGLDHIRELRRTVRVEPNNTARIALLQPDYPNVGGVDVTVFLDERRQENTVMLRPNAIQRDSRFYFPGRGFPSYPGAAPEPLVLKSPSIRKSFPLADPPVGPMMGRMPGGMMGMGGPPPGRPPRPAGPPKVGIPADTQFPLAQALETWSTNWLAYTRYDGVIVTGDDLKALPPAVRIALWQYVETGGSLLVLGDADLRGLSVSVTKQEADGWRVLEAGFGQCLVSPDDDFERWKGPRFDLLARSWTETRAPWQGQRNSYEANQKFPVVDDIGIPIKGLFVLMLLFALAIGPINFLVLARKKRRIWMLWTTPAISLVTCLAVFGYMLLSEGWQGRLRTETLTLLDERTHRATTIGWTGVYSPLTPGDGLHFSYDTEVAPQRVEQWRRGGVRSCTIDWSRDQHFASGWVEARVPAHFQVRRSEMRRERVLVHRKEDGTLSMVNGLRVAIRHFVYLDEKGLLHTAEHIAAGAEAVLTPKNREGVPAMETMRRVFLNPSWPSAIQNVATTPQRSLRPRSYMAEVDDSPFLDDALHNAKTRKCHAVVVGLLNETEKGE